MSVFWHAVLVVHIAAVSLVVWGLHTRGLLPLDGRSHGQTSPPSGGSRPGPSRGADPSNWARRLGPDELSLLDEDQRVLYEIVARSDAEVYQKDLPDLTGFSKAKVSRLLDKLERKDLVHRLSHGMTNRVVLAPDPGR